MAPGEVEFLAQRLEALERRVGGLSDELHLFKDGASETLGAIHKAVMGMAKRAWVPGPKPARTRKRK